MGNFGDKWFGNSKPHKDAGKVNDRNYWVQLADGKIKRFALKGQANAYVEHCKANGEQAYIIHKPS